MTSALCRLEFGLAAGNPMYLRSEDGRAMQARRRLSASFSRRHAARASSSSPRISSRWRHDPHGTVQPAKVIRVIDEHTRRFIAHAPFVFVASADADGMLDISPKGDPAGFVKVLDERTIAIPDRPGNRRIDTFRNVLQESQRRTHFVIPGVTYTIRMSGKAIIVRDAELRAVMAGQRQASRACPRDRDLACALALPEMHDPLGPWQPEAWPDTSNLPSFAEVLVAHAKLGTVEETQAVIDEGMRAPGYGCSRRGDRFDLDQPFGRGQALDDQRGGGRRDVGQMPPPRIVQRGERLLSHHDSR